MLTPLDIETTVFKREWRGYSKKDVQEFMARLLPEYERLYKENMSYKERLEEIETKLSYYTKIEQSLNTVLLTAQDASEDIKVAAKKEAELLVVEAEQKARLLKTKAAQEIDEEIRFLAALKQQIEYFFTQFKSLLHTHLEMLERSVPINLQAELQRIWDKYVPVISELPVQGAPAAQSGKKEAGAAAETKSEPKEKHSKTGTG
ncbi:MAG: DivIVA domain-containing protein [Bacillota bacterium]